MFSFIADKMGIKTTVHEIVAAKQNMSIPDPETHADFLKCKCFMFEYDHEIVVPPPLSIKNVSSGRTDILNQKKTHCTLVQTTHTLHF